MYHMTPLIWSVRVNATISNGNANFLNNKHLPLTNEYTKAKSVFW